MNEQDMMGSSSTDANSDAVYHGAADPLSQLEVDLHLEFSVLRVPIGELANMRPGYVLELPITAVDATVEMVVAGQVFGKAQLVCVGDRLGARILELNHDAG